MSKTENQVFETEDIESLPSASDKVHLEGTVKLYSHENIILIPTPSLDPRDPLNLPEWRRWIIVCITSSYGTLGLTSVSGFGAVVGFLVPELMADGKSLADIIHLITYPTLFMGLGNFVSMPVALAIGRRPVFLFSIVLQVIALALCATNQNYNWHLGARALLGVAAGQSEALCPLMVQESRFLHERAGSLTWLWAIQSCAAGLLVIFASAIAGAVGWRWWYWMYTILSAALLVVAVIFIPETKYLRPASAYEGVVESGKLVSAGNPDLQAMDKAGEGMVRVTTQTHRELDTVNYKPRTWASDMALFQTKVDWTEASLCLKHMGQLIWFPNVLWAVLMNGILLGINVALGTSYGNILTAPSYNWSQAAVGYAQSGQIVVAFIALPILGWGSDKTIQYRAKRNGNIHEAEYRLIALVFPTVVGILSCVIYGQAGSYGEKYHWMAIIFAYSGQFFNFVGASICSMTYLLDSYPARQGATLVLVCCLRGIISFGLNYGLASMNASLGYANEYGVWAGLTGFFALVGVLIFIFGKRIRQATAKWAVDKEGSRRMRTGF